MSSIENEEDIKIEIEEMLDTYEYIEEGAPFEFSNKNIVFKKILNLVKNEELSIPIFKYFCDELIKKKLIEGTFEDQTINVVNGILNSLTNFLSTGKTDNIRDLQKKANDERTIYERVFQEIWDNLEVKKISFLKQFIEEAPSINKDAKYGKNAKREENDYAWLFGVVNPEDEECMRYLIEQYLKSIGINDAEIIDEKTKKFFELWRIDGITDIEYLKDEYDLFDIDTIIRVRASNLLKNAIENNSESPNKEFLNSIIKSIASNNEDNEAIARIVIAIDNYNFNPNGDTSNSENKKVQGEYLPEIIDKPDLLDKLIQIMIKDSNNDFGITTIQEVDNYEQIKKETCLKILDGSSDDLNPKIGTLPEWKKKKFALFELLYGIDYDQAENLIKKYGQDIEDIEPQTNQEHILIDYIKSLKNIMELDDNVIQRLIQNPKFIEFIKESESPEIASSYILEKDIVSIFERLYNQKIQESALPRSDTVNFGNSEILVEIYSPIDKDGNFKYTEFTILARTEGGYLANWETPKSYRDYYNNQTTEYNVNSECLINQSQIALIKKRDCPNVGYLKTGKLIMMAPWNKYSIVNASDFSPISVNYKNGNGIEYRIPERMVDNTRTKTVGEKQENNCEVVFDRLEKIDENGIKKRLPDISIVALDHFYDNNIPKDFSENVRLKNELGIPLTIIDREGFAIQEEMTIQRDLELLGAKEKISLSGIKEIEELTGKKCETVDWSEKEQLSREKIIREIIIRFENNYTGMFNTDLSNKYFTDQKRREVINTLMQVIELNSEKNPEQYINDLLTIERVIIEEKSKEQNNQGITIYKIPNEYMVLEQMIEQLLVQNGVREPLMEMKDTDELNHIIGFIYDSNLYDDNELHSTDHIVKTEVFLNILAQKEKVDRRDRLLLLIAGALHDCGREGIDEETSHAVLSAEKAGKILRDEDSTFKQYELTEDEIKKIQIIIEYHEIKEENLGKLEIENNYNGERKDLVRAGLEKDQSIVGLMNEYDLDMKNLSTVAKLCALLKDADALDRERIPNIYALTNIKYLHTNFAKNIRMLAFSNRLNNRTAKELLKKYYGIDYLDNDAVFEFAKKRYIESKEENCRLTRKEMYICLKEMGIDLERKKTIGFVRKQCEESINSDDLKQAFEMLKNDFDRVIKDESEILGG